MVNKNISEVLIKTNFPCHKEIEFVNTKTNGDVLLFIDPVLIDVGQTDFCKKAKVILDDFFNQFYNAYYINNNIASKRILLSHAMEINDTHLGYAIQNGHGNTEDGLLEIFKGVEDYITRIKISKIFELVLYVPNFAEDGMSDLLTNVLYNELSEFTLKICQKYSIKTSICPEERSYWDCKTHKWKKYNGNSLVVNGKPFLLIPKEIVQKSYKFTVDNFLRSVIVQNICDEAAYYDNSTKKEVRPLSKDKVREQLIKENGSALNAIKNFSQKDATLLNQYQNIVLQKYLTLQLSDEQLDVILYDKKFASDEL